MHLHANFWTLSVSLLENRYKIAWRKYDCNLFFFFIHFRWDIESKCNCNFYIKHERFVTALVNAASLHERFTNYNERNLISENEIISIRIIRKTSLSCKVFWWCRHDFQNRLASFIKFLIQHQLLSCSFLFFIVFHWTAMLVRCFVEII